MTAKPADKGKILDKVRKCLALSKSANEHEAAAALRQAQAMMRIHGLSDDDVGLVEYLSAQVITDYEFPKGRFRVDRDEQDNPKPRMTRPMPRTVGSVVSLIIHAMGVTAVMERQLKGKEHYIAIRYFGTRARVLTAAHAHEVVYRACGRAWRKHLEQFPQLRSQPGARAGFYYGWCSVVARSVAELVDTPEEKLLTQRKVAAHYGARPESGDENTRKIYGSTLEAGMQAGADFRIHRPIDEDRNRIGYEGEQS